MFHFLFPCSLVAVSSLHYASQTWRWYIKMTLGRKTSRSALKQRLWWKTDTPTHRHHNHNTWVGRTPPHIYHVNIFVHPALFLLLHQKIHSIDQLENIWTVESSLVFLITYNNSLHTSLNKSSLEVISSAVSDCKFMTEVNRQCKLLKTGRGEEELRV